MHYIDDGQRSPARPTAATGARFLSGEVAWRDASFDYFGGGPINIEWCYIKDGGGDGGEDAAYLDRLQITPLGGIVVTPSRVLLSEGGSAALTLSLNETPRSEVTVNLTVPTESSGDIAVSPAQAVLSPGQPTMTFTVSASEDDNPEPREAHAVNARSPAAAATMITVVILPDPLPQDSLCAALDINEEDCPTLSTGDGSSAVWSAVADGEAMGGTALRSGTVGDDQRSCLRAALRGPALVAFRWRVSSQEGADYLHYIDDGQRSPARPTTATGLRFLSGEAAPWRNNDDTPFDRTPERGAIDIEWCYIKDGSGAGGEDAGYLDRLRITPSSSPSINLKVRVYLEGALQ